MAVQEQTPYIEYVANGDTTSFALGFDCSDQDYLIVLIDNNPPEYGSWYLENNTVIFRNAPQANQKVSIERSTPLSRATNFKAYDNSFRPETINYDLDKLWLVLQEQNLIDGKILTKIKEEIEWRRSHDLNFDELAKVREAQIFSGLKQYVDTFIAANNSSIFGGVTAGIVFALDQKSVQTHLEAIYKQLSDDNLLLQSETNRALLAESFLDEKINNESNRAIGAEKLLAQKINAQSNGYIGGYGTLAELQAVVPASENVVAAVLNDPNHNPLANPAVLINGSYYYQSGNWHFGHSDFQDAMDLTSLQLKPIKEELEKNTKLLSSASLITISANKLNLEKVIDGQRLTTAGDLYAVSSHFTSDLIEVDPNTAYKSSYSDRISFYDANRKHIVTNENSSSVVSPESAVYARASYAMLSKEKSMFAKAEEYPSSFQKTEQGITFDDQVLDLIKITDKAKKVMMIDSFEKSIDSVNLLDLKKSKDYMQISLNDGSVNSTTTAIYVSDYIAVDQNTAYKKTYAARHAYYNENYQLIGTVQDAQREFVTPESTKYVRSEFLIASKATDMFCKKSEYPLSYVPFSEKLTIGDLSYDEQKIIEKLKNKQYVKIDNTLFIERVSPNLYNHDTRIIGYRLNNTTGDLVGYATADVSDFIEVDPNQIYSQLVANYTCEYDENKKFVRGYFTGEALTFTTSADTKYVRVTVNQAAIGQYILAKGAELPAYQPYDSYQLDPRISVNGAGGSKWAGKKWNAFGDSITQASYSYWRKIAADKKFAIARNYGIGGTSIAYRDAPEGVADPLLYTDKWMGKRWVDMDTDADLVTIAAGTNDFKQIQLGSFTVRDNSTVYGATRAMCEGIIDRFPIATIAAILPFHRYDSLSVVNPYSFMQLRDALLEVYDFYGIATFDSTSRLNAVRFYNAANREALSRYTEATGLTDGLHPNQLCHEQYIAPVIADWLESIAPSIA